MPFLYIVCISIVYTCPQDPVSHWAQGWVLQGWMLLGFRPVSQRSSSGQVTSRCCSPPPQTSEHWGQRMHARTHRHSFTVTQYDGHNTRWQVRQVQPFMVYSKKNKWPSETPWKGFCSSLSLVCEKQTETRANHFQSKMVKVSSFSAS